jgi:hypothetical protein
MHELYAGRAPVKLVQAAIDNFLDLLAESGYCVKAQVGEEAFISALC